MSLDVIKGPVQGNVQLFMDEAPAGPVVDMFADKRKRAQDAYVGTLDLNEGQNNLLFKIVGKNKKSKGLGLDLTNIICERMK